MTAAVLPLDHPDEAEVRSMRDAVYGVPATDHGWDQCREHWLKPSEVAWLAQTPPLGSAPERPRLL